MLRDPQVDVDATTTIPLFVRFILFIGEEQYGGKKRECCDGKVVLTAKERKLSL